MLTEVDKTISRLQHVRSRLHGRQRSVDFAMQVAEDGRYERLIKDAEAECNRHREIVGKINTELERLESEQR